MVVYNVIIHGLFKSQRVCHTVEIKNGLVQSELRADIITYHTLLVLGLCRVEGFDFAVELMKEMI